MRGAREKTRATQWKMGRIHEKRSEEEKNEWKKLRMAEKEEKGGKEKNCAHRHIVYENLRVISFESNFNLTCDTLDASQV